MELFLDGYSVLIDDDDYDIIKSHIWHARMCGTGGPYVICQERNHYKRKEYKLHRLITNAQPGDQVDHINLNTLDNRKSNLRICTHAENQHNRKMYKTNKSGYKGVYWYKPTKKWKAQISIDGKRISLGYFKDIIDAHEAYKEAAIRLYGEYARY